MTVSAMPTSLTVARPVRIWATVVKVELMDLIFAADSILVGVAISGSGSTLAEIGGEGCQPPQRQCCPTFTLR
jgi:predicted tellurium resistance membrane protein TerC